MTALLTDNLPLLAGAPNGIKKLRELILELAVRGKLVPQDPSDEPASELLKRIAEEKARLVAEGTIRKQKPLADISEEEQLFEVPSGWEWVRLGTIQTFTNGYAFKSHDFQETGIGVIRIGDVRREGFISTDGMVRFPEEKISEIDSRYFVEPGDLVISMTGDVKLAFNRSSERFLLNQRVGKISVHQASEEYICLLLITQAQEKIEQASGSVISNVSTEEINNSVISLPPLAEQHRIVAKVDELMALCDRLEARQADADSAHAQLVQALLDSLTQARDAEDFAQSWQRLAEHFHTLFTTESSIDALKQTLLQLAVMGKLVPQDPSDEPAGKILERVHGICQMVPSVTGQLNTPSGWAISFIPQVVKSERYSIKRGPFGSAIRKDHFIASGFKVYEQKNAIQDDFSLGEYYVSEEHFESLKAFEVKPGDIIISCSGTVGRVAVAPSWMRRGIINQALLKISLNNEVLMNEYFKILFPAFYMKTDALSDLQGTAQKNMVSMETLKNEPFPLPPLAEQHRIVAKVDQLMALCDQLKARLNQARQVHEQLASALVEQAVA